MSEQFEPKPGDTVMVPGTLKRVSGPDQWGPGTGRIYEVTVATADGGTDDVWTSWVAAPPPEWADPSPETATSTDSEESNAHD